MPYIRKSMRLIEDGRLDPSASVIVEGIRAGKLFIYPTDTIYGIGCDATNGPSVARIREAKKRDAKPFSVIAPSLEWIGRNCVVGDNERAWLAKLPGPYTLIMRLSRKGCVAKGVNLGLETLGVRIPDSWFAGAVAKSGVPFITTSANLTGEPHMTSLDDLAPSIRGAVDYIIYEGPLEGKPSRVIDLAAGGKPIRWG